MKKLVSILLVVCMLSALCTFTSLSVFAIAKYDVDAAMEYAAKHVNDNDGSECAEFVSKCVQAGGLNIPIKTGTKGCWDAIISASGIAGENLILNSKGYVTKNDNEDMLSRGDVVIQWCYTCDLRPHILICGGYDLEGYATFYAHNNPLDNKRYKFSSNSQHKSTCNIGAKVVQLSKLNGGSVADSSAASSVADTTTKIDSIIEAQKCGDNVYWELDNGVLTISGTGDMWAFNNGVIYDNSPSESSIALTNSVHTIIVDEGITSLGKFAFVRMTNVKNVSLPNTLKTIEAGAFFYVKPEKITYNGSKYDWKNISDKGVGTTMPLGDDFISKISFNDTEISNGSETASPYKTGIPYQIEVTDDKGNKVATANINENGLMTKLEADDYYNAYICFQPLFNVSGSFIDRCFIGAETYFEYQNSKVSSISSKATLSDKDGEHKANVFGQIIDSYNGIYEFNDDDLCIKAKLRGSYEENYWQYNENKFMTVYGYIGMAPTYYYYYDEVGRLERVEIAGPGSLRNYIYKYQSTENEHATSNIKILINNKFIQCDQPPVLVNNRTLVPMRAIFEALGAKVEWDNSTRTAIGTKEGKTVSLTIEEKAINIDGAKKGLDVAPHIINNRTMIPARAVAEAFDCDVNWNQAKQYVIITPRNQTPYRIEVLDEQNAVISTAHFDEKGRMYQINTNNYLWLFPLYVNINGNIFDEPSPFGKESFIEYDAENRISKVNSTRVIVDLKNNTEKEYPVDYFYKYDDIGLCESVNIVYALEPDKNKMITYTYADDSTRSSNYSNIITSFNAVGLLKKHHTIGQGTVLKCTYDELNNLIERQSLSSGITYFKFNYNDNQQLTNATYESLFENETVTYRYINE